MEYKITFERDPAAAEIQILSAGINEFTKNKLGFTRSPNGDGKNTPLAFFLRGAAGEVVGGVYGNYSAFGWLYVSTLWVSDLVRGGGYGTRLMQLIEREAIENGCANAYLDTFSFQALEFYKKLGYTVFGELEDFPPGHRRCFLRKKLI